MSKTVLVTKRFLDLLLFSTTLDRVSFSKVIDRIGELVLSKQKRGAICGNTKNVNH